MLGGIEGRVCALLFAAVQGPSNLWRGQLHHVVVKVTFDLPVSSLKAAGLSCSIEASMSIGLRHCWQDSAGRRSFAILA